MFYGMSWIFSKKACCVTDTRNDQEERDGSNVTSHSVCHENSQGRAGD